MIRRQFLALSSAAAITPLSAQQSTIHLPKLPYAADALEPFIDAQTMEIHHDRHHAAYVNNLNQVIVGNPSLASKPVEKLLADLDSLPAVVRTAVRNNGGGHLNHALLWQTLGKASGGPKGALRKAIEDSFGSRSSFEDRLRSSGLSVFGSGWVWVGQTTGGKLSIETAPNQDGPWLRGQTPLFGIDVWEHAYYLKYQNRRADYLSAVLRVLNWDFISARYEKSA
jgi:Fe-Mn family superoxide dismutase